MESADLRLAPVGNLRNVVGVDGRVRQRLDGGQLLVPAPAEFGAPVTTGAFRNGGGYGSFCRHTANLHEKMAAQNQRPLSLENRVDRTPYPLHLDLFPELQPYTFRRSDRRLVFRVDQRDESLQAQRLEPIPHQRPRRLST
jgi:hypothetical protein